MRFAQLTNRGEIAQHLVRRGAVTLFYADWCPFSVQMHNVVELVATKFPDLSWAKVPTEVADSPIRIKNIPTLALTGANQKPFLREGYISASKLETLVRQLETTAGIVEQPSYQLIIDMTSWRETTNAKSKVKLVDGSGGEMMDIYLGRLETQILLFFHYAREEDLDDVANSAGFTKPGRRLLKRLWRDKHLSSSAFKDIDNKDDPRYLSKLISRLNRHFGKIKVIEMAAGYRLSPAVQTSIRSDGN